MHFADVEDFLIVVTSKLIRGVPLTGDRQTDAMMPVVGNATSTFSSAAFDARTGFIYYSDAANKIIMRVHRDGSSKYIVCVERKRGSLRLQLLEIIYLYCLSSTVKFT